MILTFFEYKYKNKVQISYVVNKMICLILHIIFFMSVTIFYNIIIVYVDPKMYNSVFRLYTTFVLYFSLLFVDNTHYVYQRM